MEPSEAYQPTMATVHEKIYLSKVSPAPRPSHPAVVLRVAPMALQVVIEFCEESPNGSYEDMLNKIQVCCSPPSIRGLSLAPPLAPPLCRPRCLRS